MFDDENFDKVVEVFVRCHSKGIYRGVSSDQRQGRRKSPTESTAIEASPLESLFQALSHPARRD